MEGKAKGDGEAVSEIYPETPGVPLPDWERELIALDVQRHEQFTGWIDKQGYVDPEGDLAEAFKAGWMDGAAHVANPTAEDYDRAAVEIAEPARWALVEQMGHRATVGTVREVTFLGEPMLEVTDLLNGSVHLVSPKSLYEVSWLSEEQAHTRVKPWTAVALPAGDPWGTAESDEDDDDQGPEAYKRHRPDCVCPDCSGARSDAAAGL